VAILKVRVAIDTEAAPNNCYNNCVAKVARDGGAVVTGWRHITADSNLGLIKQIQHHAVWRSPAGELIDITPQVGGAAGQEAIIVRSEVEFEVDDTATFLEGGKSRVGRIEKNAADPHGLLAKAVEWANTSLEHEYQGNHQGVKYADRRVKGFLQQHLRRINGK
jgi:hypothetical protein